MNDPRERPLYAKIPKEKLREQQRLYGSDPWYPQYQPPTHHPQPFSPPSDRLRLDPATAICISRTLALPKELATQSIALLAKKGSGKTYTACVLIEEFDRLRIPVVAIDPMGGMWGLAKAADGVAPGLDMTIIGGDHATKNLGPVEEMVDYVMESRRTILFDLSHLRRDEQRSFVTCFLREIYFRKSKNKSPLHLVLDEADLWAPQATGGDDIGKQMRDAVEDIVRRGRQFGIGETLATQRPSVIHKNVLSQTQVLVSGQMTAPQDREAIDEWVKANGDEDRRDELLRSLPSLPRGTAWFWSPGWGGDIFQCVKVRKRRTFDSSSTPAVVLDEARLLDQSEPSSLRDDESIEEEEPIFNLDDDDDDEDSDAR